MFLNNDIFIFFLFMGYYHLLKRLVRKVEIENRKSKVNSLHSSFADNKTNYSMHFECGRNVVWAASGGVPSCDAPNPPVLNCGRAGVCWGVPILASSAVSLRAWSAGTCLILPVILRSQALACA